MPRRIPNAIIAHEIFQPRQPNIWDFVNGYWARDFTDPLKPLNQAQNFVDARINHGRWLVDCPSGCAGALIVTHQQPYFICVDCGSPENGENWYHVRFPPDRVRIEIELLKRPNMQNRNWDIWETLQDVINDNAQHGIPFGGGPN